MSDMDPMAGHESSSKEGGNAPLNCICRKGDMNGFTIGCSICNELFHGHCMSVTETMAKAIREWYCVRCRAENPSLEVKYHSEKTCEKDTDLDRFEKHGNPSTAVRKCGQCEPCGRTEESEDCAQRDFCADTKTVQFRQREVRGRKRLRVKDEELALQEEADEVKKRREEEMENKPRQCLGPSCVEAARVDSKYCSEDCGMRLAADRIRRILPQRIQQWRKSPCVAEELGTKQLERIRRDQQSARLRLVEMERRFHELEAVIAKAKQQAVRQDEEELHRTIRSKKESEDLRIACVSCGHTVNSKVALGHMERCYAKYERQTSFGSRYPTRIEGATRLFCDTYDPRSETYCKRLEVLCPEHSPRGPIQSPGDEVCGCPLVRNVFEPTGDHCSLSKRTCSRHNDWEKLWRAEVDLERVRALYKLEELSAREHHVQTDMSNRAGLLPLLLHQTIQHDPSMSDLRSNKDRQPASVPHQC